MLGDRRQAEQLQRALDGAAPDDAAVGVLVRTAARVSALADDPSGLHLARRLAPSPDFVVALGRRLEAEAALLPARPARTAPARTAPARRAPGGPPPARPAVLTLGRGLPRLLAGAAASLLVVAVALGASAGGSLPGDLLYPVRGLMDDVAVQLAGSDLARGRTLVSQGQAHLGDALELAGRDEDDPARLDLVDEALRAATGDITAGQRLLLADYQLTRDPARLVEMQRALVAAGAALARLGEVLGAGDGGQRLAELLQATQSAVLREAAVCGPGCTSALSSVTLLPSAGPAGTPSSAPPTAPGTPATTPPGTASVPTAPVPTTPGVGTTPPVPGTAPGPSLPPTPSLPRPTPSRSVPGPTVPPVPTVPTVPSVPVPPRPTATLPSVPVPPRPTATVPTVPRVPSPPVPTRPLPSLPSLPLVG